MSSNLETVSSAHFLSDLGVNLHDDYSYHHAKILIGFLYKRDSNLDSLLDNKKLYQLS